MADQSTAKGGGARKIGRKSRKGRDVALSAMVRGKKTVESYLKAHKLTTHFAYARKQFNFKK